MADEGDSQEPKQAKKQGRHGADELLLGALTAGATAEQAGQQAGVSARTVSRRLADPGFQARLAAARSALLSRTADRLASGAILSANALIGLVNSKDERVQLAAAKGVIELACKVREVANLEGRLAEMEARLAQMQGSEGGQTQ